MPTGNHPRPSLIRQSDGTVRESTVLGDPGHLALPIDDRVVCAVGVSRFDPFLRLEFWEDAPDSAPGSHYTLAIGGPLRIVTATQEWSIDPRVGPDAAYLLLVTKKVARAFASDDGGLEVEFSDGDRLVVPPFEYEPWHLEGEDGSLFVSDAGGGLSVWDANET